MRLTANESKTFQFSFLPWHPDAVLIVKKNKAFDPVNISLLSAVTVMLEPEFISNLVQKPGFIFY